MINKQINICFLGGSDELTEGEWNWMSNEPFNYTNWGNGEPNNAWYDEDYIATGTTTSEQWNDSRNWFTINGFFLIEWNNCQEIPLSFEFNCSCCLLRGDVNHDSFHTISDLTYFVDFLFNSGPEPQCFDEGDINNDEVHGISDLTYFVDYLFNNGPAPPDCP